MTATDKDALVEQIDRLLKEHNYAIEGWFANQIHNAVYCATEVGGELIRRSDAIEAVRMSEHRITIADEQGGVGTVKWDMWGVYTAEAVEAIKALPSVDAEQVTSKLDSAEAVQGEWKRVETRTYKGECTNCGFRHIFMDGHDSQYRFCPYCGAKMSKGGDDK